MIIPRTLHEIMSMGRACLDPLVRYYVHQMGLGAWDVTATWVDQITDDEGGLSVGCCWPDPQYQRARIEILWPPPGDVEQTVAHEVAHCQTAKLAILAGASPGTYARDAWEEVAEQNARGYVATRRGELRQDITILARAARARVMAAVAARRDMDPQALASIAVEGGAFTAREDVPPDVKDWIVKAVEAMAGGSPDTETEMTEDPPMVQEDDNEKMPAYMRAFDARLEALAEKVERIGEPTFQQSQGAKTTPELTAMRQVAVEGFLAQHGAVLSPQTERELVARGDLKLARMFVSEAKRATKPANRIERERPAVDFSTDIKPSAAAMAGAAMFPGMDPKLIEARLRAVNGGGRGTSA